MGYEGLCDVEANGEKEGFEGGGGREYRGRTWSFTSGPLGLVRRDEEKRKKREKGEFGGRDLGFPVGGVGLVDSRREKERETAVRCCGWCRRAVEREGEQERETIVRRRKCEKRETAGSGGRTGGVGDARESGW
ncbi:hypothetical protein HAX54_004709 [Datura stramonium]|uniref:Uncharacterized protein n=1 Tax=Datura stramonium TaxID=4076 RepID=A0ABS8RUA9_DATST|nr:hypothetical protein [Datura stramonium]